MTATVTATATARSVETAPPPLQRDRALRAWVGASGISYAGDSAFLIAFAWAAVHEAGPTLAGFLVGVEMVPQAALLLVGGALADRLDTRRVMLCCNAARVLVLVGAALAWQTGAPCLPLMFGVAICFGIADALYQPASATLPRQMVRSDDLGSVAGMFQVVRRVAGFAGAALGGWLAAAYGLGIAMLVDAGTFVVVAVVLGLAVRPRFILPRTTGDSVLTGVRAGLGYLRSDRLARTFVVALSGINLFVGPVTAVGVPLQATAMGWGAGMVGLIEASIGLAAAAGALVAIRHRPRHDAAAGFALLIAQGAALAGFGTPYRWAALLAAVVVGLTAGSASVLVSGAFQRCLHPAFLGRVSSMTNLGDLTLMPAMLPLFGWLAHDTSVLVACTILGVGMVLLSLWGASRPVLRAVERPCADV